MAKNLHNFQPASKGQDCVYQSDDPVDETCRHIAQLCQNVMTYAHNHDAYVYDARGFVTGMKPGTCQKEVTKITALFNSLAYSDTLQEYTSLQAEMVASALRETVWAQARRQIWHRISGSDKMSCLLALSRFFVERINDDTGYPLMRYTPMLIKRTLAKDTAMEVGPIRYPGHKQPILTIFVDQDHLASADFDTTSSILWHEHQHIHMAFLREAFSAGNVKPSHELYADLLKSTIIQRYGIKGNYFLSYDIYRAEPEEKICFQSEDSFLREIQYTPHPSVRRMAP